MNKCRRCGTCCIHGGPTLHTNDNTLLDNGVITYADLTTIREGEPVHHPITGRVITSPNEFIKVSGTARSWQCRFYTDDGCGIYHNRPLECRTLQCWNTEALEKLLFTDLLNRFDILAGNHPIRPAIEVHEEHFSHRQLAFLALRYADQPTAVNSTKLTEFLNRELTYRLQIAEQNSLSVPEELFFFGRPLFQSLEFFGLVFQNHKGRPTVEILTKKNG